MNKVWILVKREYRAAVRTKGFLISLIFLPIMMGGNWALIMLTKDKVDLKDKIVLVIDESDSVGEFLVNSAKDRNKNYITDKETGEKIQPEYFFNLLEKESDFESQKLALSDQVRDREIHAFVHIGPMVIHPGEDKEGARIRYFAENSSMDPVKGWVSSNANSFIRQARVEALGVDKTEVQGLFQWIDAEGMGLVTIDIYDGHDVINSTTKCSYGRKK